MSNLSRISILFILTLYSLGSFGEDVDRIKQPSMVYQCREMKITTDNKLVNAVNQLLSKYPELYVNHNFNQACSSKKYIIDIFKQTLGKNYLTHIQSYEESTIVNGQGYFQVARFIISEPSPLQNLIIGLKQAKGDRLNVKANERYRYFITDNGIVFMISSGKNELFKLNQSLFNELENYFNTDPT